LTGTGRSSSTFAYDSRSPYIHQYSFDVQRQLGAGFVATMGYVGSTGRNLINGSAGLNINQLDPQFFGRTDLSDQVPNPFFRQGGTGLIGSANISRAQSLLPHPQFQTVTIDRDDTNRSQYHSLALKGERRFKNGFDMVATYTWAKQMDMNTGGAVTNFFNAAGAIQNVYDLEREYSWSNFIAPHRVNVTTTYELPFGKGKSFASGVNTPVNYLIGGWSLNVVSFFQSGFPLAVTQLTNSNSPFGAPGQRPSAAPGVSPFLEGTGKQGVDYGYLNPSAFLLTPRGQFGNLSRTINVLGPGQMNWDMSLFKNFAVRETVKAQFRVEAINAFNSVIFSGPETRLGNPLFGRSTGQANFPRFVQLALRVTF
jgi:trimeric autotransporter adhesin